MKKFIIVNLSFFTTLSFAQMQDLAELANGDFVAFQPVFDDDEKLYDYFTLYNQDMINDKFRNFEYVLLDRIVPKNQSESYMQF
jgi:hypothetical protein